MNVKVHVKENKYTYITGAICLAIGAISGVATAHQASLSNAKITQLLSYKPHAHLEVYIEALGDPGNIIQDVASGTIYASQNQAANALGVHKSLISKHLADKIPDVHGHIFTKLGKAQVAE